MNLRMLVRFGDLGTLVLSLSIDNNSKARLVFIVSPYGSVGGILKMS